MSRLLKALGLPHMSAHHAAIKQAREAIGFEDHAPEGVAR